MVFFSSKKCFFFFQIAWWLALGTLVSNLMLVVLAKWLMFSFDVWAKLATSFVGRLWS